MCANDSVCRCLCMLVWIVPCSLVSVYACFEYVATCMFVCFSLWLVSLCRCRHVIVHMTVCIFFCLCTPVCVHSYQWVYAFVCMCVFTYVFVLVSWMLCLGYETVYTGSGFKRHGHLWSLFWEMWNPWHCGFTRRHGCQWNPPLGLPWALSFLIHQMQTRSGTSSYKHQH